VTRQRKTRTWKIDSGYHLFELDEEESRNFPWEPDTTIGDGYDSEDVEEPNDDDNDGGEDRTPKNDILYSWDNPAVYKKYMPEELRSYQVSKNWFKEFVRARAKSSSFTNSDADVQGSRTSDKYDWHYVLYANRQKADGLELAVDNDYISASYPVSLQVDMATHFDVETPVGSSIPYDLGAFNILYIGINTAGDKEILVGRFDGMTNTDLTVTIPADETEWSFNFEGIAFSLKELQDIPDWTFINFNTFRTDAASKENIVGPGTYTNFTK